MFSCFQLLTRSLIYELSTYFIIAVYITFVYIVFWLIFIKVSAGDINQSKSCLMLFWLHTERRDTIVYNLWYIASGLFIMHCINTCCNFIHVYSYGRQKKIKANKPQK